MTAAGDREDEETLAREDTALSSAPNRRTLAEVRSTVDDPLRSLDRAVRKSALDRSVRDADRAGADAVGRALAQSEWPVCDELAAALARMGTPLARAALFAALKARRHHVRSAAIRALCEIGGPCVSERIAELGNDPAYEVRQDVAEALSRLRGTE